MRTLCSIILLDILLSYVTPMAFAGISLTGSVFTGSAFADDQCENSGLLVAQNSPPSAAVAQAAAPQQAAPQQTAAQQKAARQRAAQRSQTTFDQATMVILAPTGPVFADMRISVAKVPYRTWVGKFLAQQMDQNRDGKLSESELDLLTTNMRKLANVQNPGEVRDSMKAAGLNSAKAADGAFAVSTAEFAEWLRVRLPRAFDLIAQPQPADDAVRLASLIDKNSNGIVTPDELRASFQTLRFRDLDNDETFSVAELLPYRDPRSQFAALTPDAASLPFYHLTDDSTTTLAAERLLSRYGDGETIARDVLRVGGIKNRSDNDSAAAAGDSSGISELPSELSKSPLIDFLKKPVFHLAIDVKLSDQTNVSDIDVTLLNDTNRWCNIVDDQFGQTYVRIDGLPIRIVARGGGSSNRNVARGFLGQTFVMIDADRNQYLDESEFSGIVEAMSNAGASGDFSAVDLNQDKMVTRAEIFSYVDRDQMAKASRIEVSVKQDGKTLFSLLDGNKDRRLTLREVRSGSSVLKQYDLNGDGSFAESELGTEYVLTFGLGQADVTRNSGMSNMMMNGMQGNSDALLPGREGLSGPEWFKRMDRNQDGDVSRREFLGTADHFLRIDSDNDGLLSADEALAISQTSTGSSSPPTE